MNAYARLEYVSLRLVRRFLLSEKLTNRIAAWLPYYRSSVNETSPESIVAAYQSALQASGVALENLCVVEAGAGRTNVVAYGLAAAGAKHVCAMEPFVRFDTALDGNLLRRCYPNSQGLREKVARATSFDELPEESIDLVVSNSVLEHVGDVDRFFADCHRVLRPGGVMVHLVDYRDHFFKYPYAFLTFDDSTWSRWLNPGDLPRWRMHDHVSAMGRACFDVDVVEQDSMPEEFARIKHMLAPRFASAGPDVAVTQALLVGRCRK